MFHILVVDDDKHTRKLLRAVLENAHYTVTTATNGEEALEALDKEHIDLVVLDIMMPKLFDTVTLKNDDPETGVKEGTEGTIVDVLGNGKAFTGR